MEKLDMQRQGALIHPRGGMAVKLFSCDRSQHQAGLHAHPPR